MSDFDSRLARLEELSAGIKGDDVTLDDAFSYFKEGVKLSHTLEKDLQKKEEEAESLKGEEAPPLEEGLFDALDDALKRLEKLSADINQSESFDGAFKSYKAGIKLTSSLKRALGEMDRKVEKWTANGAEPFDEALEITGTRS